MSSDPAWVAWPILVPLGGALLCVLAGRRAAATLARIAALGTIWATATVAWQVKAHGVVRHAIGGWEAPLGIDLRVDGLAALMLVTVGVVGALVAVYAIDYFRPDSREAGVFLPLWLFAWAALNALFLSADIFNQYVTLELTTLAAVGLITLAGERAALEAGVRYLLLALAGSLAYLLGVALLYGAYAALDIGVLGSRVGPGPVASAALVAMALGLCLKTALFPFHGWLPPAHSSAPAPVSALLSAVVVMGSFYLFFRLWFDVFHAILLPEAAQLLGALGGAAVLWGSLLALRQRRLKLLVAYSTVAQIGYLFLLFPLDTPAAQAGGIYLAISHAAAKASMFMAVGTIQHAVGHDDLRGLPGVAHHLPLTFFALGIAGMSLMGLPPSGGFVGKWLLLRAAVERGQWWWVIVLLAGALLTAAYVFRVLRSAFVAPSAGGHLRPVARRPQLASLALALVALALGIAPGLALELLQVGSLP